MYYFQIINSKKAAPNLRFLNNLYGFRSENDESYKPLEDEIFTVVLFFLTKIPQGNQLNTLYSNFSFSFPCVKIP
jgi:hypothetical protein